jgi:hypothetical protein
MNRKFNLLRAAALALVVAFPSSSAIAAVVTWSAPTTIGAISDVSTSGALIGAANLGIGPPLSQTVNGVNFASWDPGSSASSGPFSLPGTIGNYGTATNVAPFGNLPTAYKDLLRDGGYTAGGTSLTISGLTIGQTYAFQWWSTAPTPFAPFGSPEIDATITATAGNGVTLDPNLSNVNGGLGQFAIGSFTADGATQTLAFTAGSISAIQLRQTSGASTVPDAGGTLAMLGAALAGLIWLRRRLA